MSFSSPKSRLMTCVVYALKNSSVIFIKWFLLLHGLACSMREKRSLHAKGGEENNKKRKNPSVRKGRRWRKKK